MDVRAFLGQVDGSVGRTALCEAELVGDRNLGTSDVRVERADHADDVRIGNERVGVVRADLRIVDAVQRVVLDVRLDDITGVGCVPLRYGDQDTVERRLAVRHLTAREREVDADRDDDRRGCRAAGQRSLGSPEPRSPEPRSREPRAGVSGASSQEPSSREPRLRSRRRRTGGGCGAWVAGGGLAVAPVHAAANMSAAPNVPRYLSFMSFVSSSGYSSSMRAAPFAIRICVIALIGAVRLRGSSRSAGS